MTGKQTSPEHPTPKPPIYSCEVIQTACRVLEAIATFKSLDYYDEGDDDIDIAHEAIQRAHRIIRDGLASQERSIKGETT